MEASHRRRAGDMTTTMVSSIPDSLFDAIAQHDYDGMVGMYASNAREAILSYLNVQNRWSCSSVGGGEPHTEEKLDEFFQHLSYRESSSTWMPLSNTSSQQDFLSSFVSPSLSPRRSGSRDFRSRNKQQLLKPQQQEFQTKIQELSEIMNIVSITPSAKGDNSRATTTKASSLGSSSTEQKQSYPVKKTKKLPSSTSPTRKTTFSTTSGSSHAKDQIDLLGWESAAILSNSRPPSSFIVYAKDVFKENTVDEQQGDEDQSMTSTANATNNIDEENNNNNSGTSAPPPPLFDGAVANATPPAFTLTTGGVGTAAATTTTSAGGSGTSLHFACAIDSPLALAILLVMGGDAAAPHTAFRRMIMHEAACNGALNCLKVLLELGKQCKATMMSNTTNDNNSAAATTGLSSSSSPRQKQFCLSKARITSNGNNGSTTTSPSRFAKPSIFFPYLGSSISGKSEDEEDIADYNSKVSASTTSTTSAATATASLASVGGIEQQQQEQEQEDLSFVSTLRKILNLSQQVQLGQLSEGQAAMLLLSNPEQQLLDTSVIALSKSCTFEDDSLKQRNVTRFSGAGGYGDNDRLATISKLHGYSDGHGNTPLHWAAFKNEIGCVSELLKYRANPNARAHPSGWTPLHDGAYSNAAEAVELLLKAGADVDALANSGATPLCFAAQEDAHRAAQILLENGADLTARCCGHPGQQQNQHHHHHHHPGRFSGYTPLHYCAHYNAHRAAKVLLGHITALKAMEIPDLNDRLPIHVAVARGSSDVLRELLRNGARVDTHGSFVTATGSPSILPGGSSPSNNNTNNFSAVQRGYQGQGGQALSPPLSGGLSPRPERPQQQRYNRQHQQHQPQQFIAPRTPPSGRTHGGGMLQHQTHHLQHHSPNRSMNSPGASSTTSTNSPGTVAPVSSPILRSMIPSRPITSSKPWNCLTQHSIDECRDLITEVEQNWTPTRHSLFTPTDRRAVVELLRVGKRLEQMGTGIYILDLWPLILSFCGRGWFEVQHQQQLEQQGQQNYPPTCVIGRATITTAELGQHNGVDDIITSSRSQDDEDDDIMEFDRSVTPPPSNNDSNSSHI